MYDEKNLINAIIDAPNDVNARSAYGDWLAEYGDYEKFAFIQAQQEAAQHPHYCAAHILAMHKAREIFAADILALNAGKPKIIPAKWQFESVNIGSMNNFHRGLHSKITISDRSESYRDNIDKIASDYPAVQYVTTCMGETNGQLGHLLASALMQRLEGINLVNNTRANEAALRCFFADPRIGRLRELSFYNYNLSAAMLEDAVKNPDNFKNIQTIALDAGGDVEVWNQAQNNPGYREFLLRLAGSEFCKHLQPRKLVLKDLDMSENDWRTLLASDFTKRVTELDVRNCSSTPGLLDIILHSQRAKQLKSLTITPHESTTLASSFTGVSLPELEHLDLSGKNRYFVSFNANEISNLLTTINAPNLKNFACTLDSNNRRDDVPNAQAAIITILTPELAQKFPQMEVMNLTRHAMGTINLRKAENTSKDTITRFALAQQLAAIRAKTPGAFPNLTVLNDTPVSQIDLSQAEHLRDAMGNGHSR